MDAVLVRVWVLMNEAGEYVVDDDHYHTDGEEGRPSDNLLEKWKRQYGSYPLPPYKVVELKAAVERPAVEKLIAEVV